MACSLPHTDSKVEALVQRLINEDKGHQDVILDLAFHFEDSCAVRDDLRKTYEKQMDAKLAWFQEKYSCRTHG
ncbi:hypothetical protein Tco_0639929, partial [Tanacetum coccineum]